MALKPLIMDVTHRCHLPAPISLLPPAADGLLAPPKHQLAQCPWDKTWLGSISGTKPSVIGGRAQDWVHRGPGENGKTQLGHKEP